MFFFLCPHLAVGKFFATFADVNIIYDTMKRILTLLLSCILCSGVALAAAYEPKTVPNPRAVDAHAYVANPDGILAPDEVAQIQRTAARIDSLAEVELCVVVLDDIGDYDAYDFALELANLWGVGKREKNNGIVLFLSTGARRVQIVKELSAEFQVKLVVKLVDSL